MKNKNRYSAKQVYSKLYKLFGFAFSLKQKVKYERVQSIENIFRLTVYYFEKYKALI